MLQVLALWVGLLAPGGDAKLHLTVDPDDAVVEVNGKRLKGFKSGEALSLPPGNVTVEVGADGYLPQKKSVRLEAGKSERLSIKLAKKSGGTLTPVGKGNVGGKPGPIAKPAPTPAPAPRPGPVAKPDDKPAPRPIGKTPDRNPPKSPIGKPDKKDDFRPKPKDDDGPRAKPKDDDGPRRKPKADDGPRRKPKDDARRPRPKSDDRPRPVRKPYGGGGGYGGDGVRDDRDTGPTSLKPYAALSFVVGGLAVTGGVVAGIYADKSADKFTQETVLSKKRDYKDESESRAMLSNVLYGVGATGMVVGALLWAMSPDEGAYGAQVMPLADGAMVGWGGTF